MKVNSFEHLLELLVCPFPTSLRKYHPKLQFPDLCAYNLKHEKNSPESYKKNHHNTTIKSIRKHWPGWGYISSRLHRRMKSSESRKWSKKNEDVCPSVCRGRLCKVVNLMEGHNDYFSIKGQWKKLHIVPLAAPLHY